MPEYPDHCPTCHSNHPDIHGQVFKPGPVYDGGQPCENVWHKGKNYNPDMLLLTIEDIDWLKGQLISPL